MEFSRQECWRGWPFPFPGDVPDPGIECTSLVSPALPGGFLKMMVLNIKYGLQLPHHPIAVGWKSQPSPKEGTQLPVAVRARPGQVGSCRPWGTWEGSLILFQSFYIASYGKIWMNFLANLIYLSSCVVKKIYTELWIPRFLVKARICLTCSTWPWDAVTMDGFKGKG